MKPTVAIVGAGVGGLALAQGLTRAGLDASVYERDVSPEFRAQGYRVTLRHSGVQALRRCLPPENFESLLRSSQIWNGMNVLDQRLETLLELPNPKHPMRSIDRLTLRRILMQGIEDRVHFGKAFARYEQDSTEVRLHCADNTQAVASLLVGADGSRSEVRRALIPAHAELADTGQRDLAGKVPMTPRTRQLIKDMRVRSLSVVTSIAGPTMVLIPQEFGDATAQHATEDYLYWGLVAPRECYAEPGQPDPTAPETLRQLAREITRDWHPLFASLIDMTPADAMQLLAFHSSVPHGPWQSSRVTLLGDAVHAMVPMRGEGANSALYDADLLTAAMREVLRGQPLAAAVSSYEAKMLKYGFRKVNESLSSLDMFVSGSRLKRRAMHGVLRAVERGRSLFRANRDLQQPVN